jgi:hypothetical protein
MATLQGVDGASSSLLLTISVTDISWLHEQSEPPLPLTPAVFHILLALFGWQKKAWP